MAWWVIKSVQGLFCVLKKRKRRTFDVRKAPPMAQSPCPYSFNLLTFFPFAHPILNLMTYFSLF